MKFSGVSHELWTFSCFASSLTRDTFMLGNAQDGEIVIIFAIKDFLFSKKEGGCL